MKQRLLLALLVLFASVGTTWADTGSTVKIPAKSPAVSISFTKTGTGDLSFTNGETELTVSNSKVTINPADAEQTITITIPETITSVGLTVDGQVSGISLSDSKYTSLTVNNNNQKLTSLSLTDTKLKTLSVNNCGLGTLPTSGFDDANAVTVNMKNNLINQDLTSWTLTRTAKLTYELDGNQITKIPTSDIANVTFNYGTQIVKPTLDKNPIANRWFDVSSLFTNHIPALSQLEKAKANVSWNFSGNPMNQNGWEYKFFTGSKYLQGAVVCKIVPNSALKLPSYAIHLTVDPAQFKLKSSATTGGELTVNNLTHNGDAADVTGMVCDGDILLFTAKPTNSASASFSKYNLSDNSFTTTGVSNQYKVAVTKSDIDEVSVEAEFTQKTYAVTITKSGSGSYEVVDENNQPVTETSLSLPYYSKLYIKVTPEAGFQALVSKNGDVISPKTIDPFKDYYEVVVTSATAIKILFEAASKDPVLKIPANTHITKVWINGEEKTPGDDTSVSIKKGNTVIVKVDAQSGHKVTQIMLDGVVKSKNYKAEFTMPDADATLTFTTVAATDIQIIPSDNTFTYDGNTKTFQFETVPAGITGFTIYYKTANSGYSTDLPKGAGEYFVKLYRSADALYSGLTYEYLQSDKTETTAIDESKLTMKINPAEPKINSTSSVTVDPSTKAYKISGGSATPSGTWKVVDTSNNDAEISYCTQTESHVVTVQFTPSDNVNYTSVKRQVPVTIGTALANYAISWNTVPAGMTFTVKNGDQVITSGTKVAKGTNLTLKLEYPTGYSAVKVVEDNAQYEQILPVAPAESSSGMNCTYKVEKEVRFKFEYSGSMAGMSTPKIELKLETDHVEKYDGSVHTVKTRGNTGYYLNWTAPNGTPANVQLKVTYKQGTEAVVSPVNAGKYTVCVHIPEFTEGSTTYAATDVEFTDAFVIAKGTPTVAKWPKTAMLGIGQLLSQAKFIGGQADVAGAFAFVDGTIVPEADKKYSVKFVPVDTNNYEEATVDKDGQPKQLQITLSDKRVVVLESMVGGSVVVKDKATNKEYKSGDELPSSVKEIIITAVPNTGYKLETLTVNGSAFTSGSSYTLGTTSVTIGATFYQEFTVSVSTTLKGIELVLPTSKVVKKGGDYSFTVKGLAADLARLVVSDGTNTYTVSNGACKITNITANKTITVTMASGATPTPIDLTKIAEVVNSHMGKPMGTIQVEVISATRAASTTAYYGDKIKLTAVPASGCRFVKWIGAAVPASQATANPLIIELTSAAYEITAEFAGSPTGAEVIEGVDIYGSNGEIVVKCDGAARITIVSMNGQSKQQEISGDTRIPAGAGIYGIVFEQGNNVMRTKVAVK